MSIVKYTQNELTHIARVASQKGMIPYKDEQMAFAAILAGAELGLPPMVSLRAFNWINGKPVLSADGMLALIKRNKVCKYFHLVSSTDTEATYETLRLDEPAPTRMSFTNAQAEAAGLANKENWRKWRQAMLRARAASALARAVYPDLLIGVYAPEEFNHFDTGAVRVDSQAAEFIIPDEVLEESNNE